MTTLCCPSCGHLIGTLSDYEAPSPAVALPRGRTESARQSDFRYFMEECTVLKDGSRLLTSDLLVVYRAWCHREAAMPMSPQAFGRQIKIEDGLEQTRSSGRRYYKGLQFTGDFPESVLLELDS